MGDADSVTAAIEKSLRDNPEDHNKRLELATRYMTTGDYYSAAAELQRVVRNAPPDDLYKEAYYQLGMVLRTMGNFPEALKCMEKFLEVEPQNGSALYYAGLLYNEMGNHEKAREALTHSIALLPAQSYLHYALGNVLMQMGKTDDAIKQFLEAKKLNPKDIQAMTGLGLACLIQGAYQEAEKVLKELLEVNPKDSTAAFLYAWALIKVEEEAEAFDWIAKYVKNDPVNPLGFLSLSALHYMLGEYGEGKDAYAKGTSLLKPLKDPIFAGAFQVIASSLAEIAEVNEMFEQAEADLKKNMVKIFQELMEMRDPLLREKSEKIAFLARDMARRSNKMDDDEIENVHTAAALCNLGTAFITDAILYKEEKLSDDEKRLLASHPLMSMKILHKMEALEDAARLIRHHHERFNGTGYPDRLKGDDIPLGSGIIGIADFYIELTLGNKRQKPAARDEVLRTLQTLKGNFFSKEVVDLLAASVNAVGA